MDILYVKGKKNNEELIMTLLVPVLMCVLTWVMVRGYAGFTKSWTQNALALPMFLFGTLWWALLSLTGLASYRVKLAEPSATGHGYYAMQLLTAFLWSLLFYRFERYRAAFFLAMLYLLLIAATYFEFDKVDRRAGFLTILPGVWGIVIAVMNFMLTQKG